MACALITLISMIESQWVKDHQAGSLWLGIALLCGCVFSLIFWIATGEKSSGRLKQTGNIAGRDNAGTQIDRSIIGDSAIEKLLRASRPSQDSSRLFIESANYLSTEDRTRNVDVTECLRALVADDKLTLEIQNHNFIANGTNYVPKDPHTGEKKQLRVVYSFNNGPLQAVVEPEGAVLRLPQPETRIEDPKPKLPNLKLELVRTKALLDDEGVYRYSESGDECIAVIVHNHPATKSESALDAKSTFASLTFMHGTSRTYVDRACWLDHEENEIWIDVSTTAKILIGFPFKKQFTWESANNPNRFERSTSDWNRPPILDLEERLLPWHDGSSITVDVRVISNATATKGTTLAHRRMRLDRYSVSYHGEWVE